MNMKRMKFFLAALCFLLLTGCQSKKLPAAESSTPQPTSHSEESKPADSAADPSSEETEGSSTSDTPSGTETVPDSTASKNASSQTTANSENPNKTDVTPPTPNTSSAAPTSPPVTETPTSRPTEPEPPAESEEPTTKPPVSSEPSSTTSEYDLVPGQLYDDPEKDPYGIVAIIRKYAESKGFVLNQSLNMGNSGWMGRPNINDLGVNETINSLVYFVDETLKRDGPTYYRVIFRIFEGKLEYMFLTA